MNDIEKEGSYYGVQTFSYNELQRATNNFDSKKEVGDEGFGAVYQGKLRDGSSPTFAAQTLFSSTAAPSTHKLLLIYEYIPNGTVADHLHGDCVKPGSLSWTTRMSIAFETASALAYLHAFDVIHRDVKTNNILLDNNFCVKGANFELSLIFPTDVTYVSMALQGTLGYVDPEYP
ncbi:hypothetical protein HYC85_030733 [Camellia sinensis]|uniref:Protein kinase domain-containing protein n=1 Tax=Camellia sinensis TaxID=4442 RepID=A0A7J7G1M2_CAMSI|nr:hypothetical protein HYC85_030733 [Camellia sinensis]